MAANGNYAQWWITAVDEIRSGGEIVDNLARMSEAIGLLAGGPACPRRKIAADGAQHRPVRSLGLGSRRRRGGMQGPFDITGFDLESPLLSLA
jgi:hypothetical protein